MVEKVEFRWKGEFQGEKRMKYPPREFQVNKIMIHPSEYTKFITL